MSRSILKWLLPGILILLGVGIYAQTLSYSFHFDDYYFITENQKIRDVSNLKDIWTSLGKPTRFIGMLSFAANYHFHQIKVEGYHLVNIAIHIVNGLLVYWLCQLTYSFQRGHRKLSVSWVRILSFFAAAIFITHPMNTQAITYICQRFASLATLFYLSSLCFYIQGRRSASSQCRKLCWAVAALVALLGLFTKQIVITLPLAIILYEYVFFQTRFSWRKHGWYLAGLVGLMLIIPTFYKWDFNWLFGVQIESRSHIGDIINSKTYFLTQARVLPTYLRMMLVPLGQTLDYDFHVSTSIFEWKVLMGWALILGILVSAFRFLKSYPYISFGVIWFFLTIALESSIVPIYQVIFEHRCYLPSVGFCLAMGGVIERLIRSRRKAIAILCIVVLVFGWTAYKRNQVWATEVSLWKDIQIKAPEKIRSYIHLGVAYIMEGKYELAIQEFNQGIGIRQDEYKLYHNRGIAHEMKNDLKSALQDYSNAIQLQSDAAVTYANRGGIYTRMGQYKQAFNDYTRAIELDPNYASALLNRGNLYYRFKQYSPALKDFIRAKALGSQITDEEIRGVRKLANESK